MNKVVSLGEGVLRGDSLKGAATLRFFNGMWLSPFSNQMPTIWSIYLKKMRLSSL